jgi:hypothetical protein
MALLMIILPYRIRTAAGDCRARLAARPATSTTLFSIQAMITDGASIQ